MDGVIDIKIPAWLKVVAGAAVALIGIALIGGETEPEKTEPGDLKGISRNAKGSIEF